MARPPKKRFICCLPKQSCFRPDGPAAGDIILTVDEYETIRLIDLEGSTQEECSRQMQVARTTVQSIYNEARRKLADAIVNGRRLLITGGDYRLCSRYDSACGRGCRKRCRRSAEPLCATADASRAPDAHLRAAGIGPRSQTTPQKTMTGGLQPMKIAVTFDNGEIFQHFGHTEQFKLYEVEDGHVVSSIVVDTNGSGHGALAGFLTEYGVDTLICGGIGGGAQNALASMGIRLYGGCSGSADEAVAALLAGSLDYNPDVHCDHHSHEHGEGHTCGDHGCGGHDHDHGDGGHCCH